MLSRAVGIDGLGSIPGPAPVASGSSAPWAEVVVPPATYATDGQARADRDGPPAPPSFGTGQEWAGSDTSWMGPQIPDTRMSEKYGPYFNRLGPESTDQSGPSAPTFQSSFNPPRPSVTSTSYIPNFSFDKPARPSPTPPPVFNFQPPASSSVRPTDSSAPLSSASTQPTAPSPPPVWPFDPSASPSTAFDFHTNRWRPHQVREIPPNSSGKLPDFIPIDATGVPAPHRQSSGPTIQEIPDETETSPADSSAGLAGFSLFEPSQSPEIIGQGQSRSADRTAGGVDGLGMEDENYFMDLLWPG